MRLVSVPWCAVTTKLAHQIAPGLWRGKERQSQRLVIQPPADTRSPTQQPTIQSWSCHPSAAGAQPSTATWSAGRPGKTRHPPTLNMPGSNKRGEEVSCLPYGVRGKGQNRPKQTTNKRKTIPGATSPPPVPARFEMAGSDADMRTSYTGRGSVLRSSSST